VIVKSRNFGEIEIEDSKLITFEEGIPGFEELRKFVLVTDDDGPFYWLQSAEDENIAFAMLDIFKYMPDYNPCVEDSLVEDIIDKDEKNIEIYNIAVIPENVEKMTVNLKAPVIINIKSMKGKQIISNNEEYPIKYYIYEEIKKLKEGV
jgi:flagellar assembly factor FliW